MPDPPALLRSMTSAFERVVKSIVQELDHSRELIPVDSLRSSTSFQLYCLLSRKCSSSWFWKPRFVCLNLSIKDILEPDAPEPAVEPDGPFHFHDAVDGQLKGSVELTAPGQGRFAGEAAVSGSSSASVNVCMLRVAPNTWEAMHQERRLRQPEHKVLQQLRHRGDNVFVVTEVLQMQTEVEVTRTHRHEGSGQFALPGAVCLQVAQLVIGSDWDILLFPDKKQKTFKLPQEDGTYKDWSAATEFQGLKAEVECQAKGLESLSKEVSRQLLGGLKQVLREELALQVLQESLEQGLCCGRMEPLDGPAGIILECLVLSSGELEKELAGPILYLLEALDVLNETQHMLLAEELQAGALPGQVKLVGRLLEQSSPWQEHRAISLLPKFLGSSWGSEGPAWVLLEECGLELQVGAPQVFWEPEAQGRTCALYACLSLLLELSYLC
ncbi:gasdermin-D isoform X5 [Manis pentadactyla]|uniref:gasdermin-D isoform X5 n=1 Tax=Manis pentadactyla TaxID=143292 RepID=UPI00255CCA1C|nr:gasdermin-D isoform X5 [Manis pentadactyla]